MLYLAKHYAYNGHTFIFNIKFIVYFISEGKGAIKASIECQYLERKRNKNKILNNLPLIEFSAFDNDHVKLVSAIQII